MWISLEETGSFRDIPHLFHFLELLFVALCKIDNPGAVTRISFPQWPGDRWKGKNGVDHNEWIVKTIWPNAQIGPGQGSPDLVVDREYLEASNMSKSWAKYIRRFDPYRWYRMVDIPIRPSRLPRVTYVNRQMAAARGLRIDVHNKFVKFMNSIPDIEFLDIKMENYNWKTQVEIARGTDLLIGVHGNGLSHAAFMHPHRNVIEIFVPGILFEWDYYTLSKMMGHEYMCIFDSRPALPQMFVNNRWARCTTCDIPTDPITAVIHQIKEER